MTSEFFNEVLDRKVTYKDLFLPPEGYKFHRALFTTYGLDDNMLGLLATAAFSPHHIHPEMRKRSLVLLRDDRFLIVHDHTERKVEGTDRLQLAKSERLVVPVNAGKASFHPKIAIVCFERKEDNFYRILVTSRNLVATQYFETCVILEGVDKKEKDPMESCWSQNKVSDELIDWLNDYEFTPLSAPNSGISCKVKIFYAKKTENNLYKDIFDEKKGKEIVHAVVTSPNVTKKMTEEIKVKCSFYSDKSIAHCKMYFTEHRDNSARLWIGSANCTHSGLQDNEECMVVLDFDPKFKLKASDFIRYLEANNIPEMEKADEIDNTEESKTLPIASAVCSIKKDKDKYIQTLHLSWNKKWQTKTKVKELELCLATNTKIKKKIEIHKGEATLEQTELKDISLVFHIKNGSDTFTLVAQEDPKCEETKRILKERMEHLTAGIDLNKWVIPKVPITPGSGNQPSIHDNQNSGVLGHSIDSEYENLLMLLAIGAKDKLTAVKDQIQYMTDEKKKQKSSRLIRILLREEEVQL